MRALAQLLNEMQAAGVIGNYALFGATAQMRYTEPGYARCRRAGVLRAAGITVEIDPQQYPNGRFGRLYDPEGNPIELWQPAE